MNKIKIGNLELEGNVFLAPMAGITDMTFREICRVYGASMVYSEMVSAKGILYDNDNTKQLLDISELGQPTVIQLFGSEPEILAEAAKKIEHLPFSVLDINMGCPAPKIVKNGDGSALMESPKLVAKIMETVSKAIKKPVTMKIRKGINNSDNAVEIAKIGEEHGASAVTVHGRIREQYYEGTVDLDIIKKVKESISIPVIASGDVVDVESCIKTFEYTKVDGLMIGRGSRGNPWLFRDIAYYYRTREMLPPPTPEEKLSQCLKHAKMIIAHKGEYIGIREMRKHAGWYIKGLKGSGVLRTEINKIDSYEGLETLFTNIFLENQTQ